MADIVQDYLDLCHNPMKDLRRWIEVRDRRQGRAGQGLRCLIVKGGFHADAQRTTAVVAKAGGVCGESLPELQGRMGAGGERGRADRVQARWRAGLDRDDKVQRLRPEGRCLDAAGCSYEAEADAINAVFAAKLAGLRRRLRSWEIPAAAKAIGDERQAALRALGERRQVEQLAEPEAARHAKTDALQPK